MKKILIAIIVVTIIIGLDYAYGYYKKINMIDLDGKQIALIGDSLINASTTANGGLRYTLKSEFKDVQVANYSKDGSTITDNTDFDDIVIKRQVARIQGKPDIVIFNGGVNDIIGYAERISSRR